MAGLRASGNLETLRLSNAQWEAASFFDTRSTLSSSWGALVAERDTAGNEIETHTSHTTFPDFDVMTCTDIKKTAEVQLREGTGTQVQKNNYKLIDVYICMCM